MNETSIKTACDLLRKARNILEDAWLADSNIDSAGIATATEQLDDLSTFVDGLIAPVITAPLPTPDAQRTEAETELETIRDRAQRAFSSLSDKRPCEAIAELKLVLASAGPDSLDVEVIKRVIDRLEKVVCEIKEVESLLAETDFTFGNIKVLRERMPWEDPPRLN